MGNTGMHRGFDFYCNNIPHLVGDEADAAKYLRAYDAMISGRSDDADYLDASARSALAFIAEHAFQAGWTLCRDKLHAPHVAASILRSDALQAMEAHGEAVRQALSSDAYDWKNDTPTGESDFIDNAAIPAPKLAEATL